MPPISRSRSAPRTCCTSSMASSCEIQVRRSCFGALVSDADFKSDGRFISSFLPALRCAVECAAGHGADEIAPILGARLDIHKRLNRRGGGFTGGLKRIRARRLAVERRLGFGDAARERLGAADA